MTVKEACNILNLEEPECLYYKMDRDIFLDDIRSSYLALIKQNHPDCGGDHNDSIKIIESYKFLSNKIKEKKRIGITEWFAKQGEKEKEKREKRKQEGKPRYNLDNLNKRRKTPIYQFDFDYNLIKKWESVMDASRGLNAYSADLRRAANGIYSQYRGYLWSFTDKIKKRKIKKWAVFYQYDKNNNLIREFHRVKEIKNAGFCIQNIYLNISGKTKSHKGFIWRKNKI